MPLSPNNRSCAPDTSAARDFGHRSAAGHVDRTAAHVNQGAIPVSWPSRSTAPRAYKERVPAGWRGSNRGSGVSSSARTATGFDSSSRFNCRIRGDLDVRVPRRSARARASVRRWPWSSRRGRNVQVKLIKMGGRLVRHARRLVFQLSEVSVPRRLFEGVLDRIGRLSPAPS